MPEVIDLYLQDGSPDALRPQERQAVRRHDLVDGATWIGSLSTDRAWVKNLRATGKAALDFGDGPRCVRAVWVDGGGDVTRYETAVRKKYPIASRILSLLVRGTRCTFRLEPVA